MSTSNASALVLVDFLLSTQETPPEIKLDENGVFLLSHHLQNRIEQLLTPQNTLNNILEAAISQTKKLPKDVQETITSRVRNTVTSIAMHQGLKLN